MPITTSLSSSKLRPQTSQEFDTTGRATGLVPLQRRLAFVGAMLKAPAWGATTPYVVGDWVTANGSIYRATVAGTSGSTAPSHTTGTATDGSVTWLYVQGAMTGSAATPTQVFSDSDVAAQYGGPSEVAAMVRKALRQAKKKGKTPQFWVSATTDPTGNKEKRTLTVAGTASASGQLEFSIAGRHLSVGVALSDANTTIASAIKTAIDAKLADLPVTASVSSGVVTIIANNTGVNGGDLKTSIDKNIPGVTVTIAVSTAGSGAYDITSALDALSDKTYDWIAVANHASADVSDIKDHADDVWDLSVKKWSYALFATNGTVAGATTLGTTANRYQMSIVSMEDCPAMPCEIAAAVATIRAGESRPNRNFDHEVVDLPPPPVASIYLDSEIETLLAAGVTPLFVNDQGEVEIVRLVTTKTTENSLPFLDTLDVSTMETLTYTASQVDAAWARGFRQADRSDDTIARVKSVTYGILLQEQALGYLQNVEEHKDELLVERDTVNKFRLNVVIPESVVPNLHQIAGVNALILE